MGKRVITIRLDDDTAEFLDLAKIDTLSTDISGFINSLLRQERFRQGFPAYQNTENPHRTVATLASKILHKRGAQLPFRSNPH